MTPNPTPRAALVAAPANHDHIPAMARPNNTAAAQRSVPRAETAQRSVPRAETAQRSVPHADPAEIARFDALAAEWWDPAGPMRALHAMNPLRVGWVCDHLSGPGTLLDVGCGAGLAAEALARRGHAVLGIDAAPQPLAAARAHAGDLPVEYRQVSSAELAGEGRRFSAVTALEVIEHVPDQARFLHDLAALLAPDGRLFVSTINRTLQSLAVAKIGAEYIVRMLPAGTHDWRRFPTPAELARNARLAGLRMVDSAGMSYQPLQRRWRLSRDLSINYIAAFAAPG